MAPRKLRKIEIASHHRATIQGDHGARKLKEESGGRQKLSQEQNKESPGRIRRIDERKQEAFDGKGDLEQ